MQTQRTGRSHPSGPIVKILNRLSSDIVSLGLLALVGFAPTQAIVAYGTINNLDTVNDTGVECHGFEIEIEDLLSADITYTYNWNHYGTPRITEDNSNPLHRRVRTATPGSGFAFANWTDNGRAVSSSTTYTFTNLVNRSLVATFVPVPALNLSQPQLGTLVLTWSTNYSSMALQQSAVLGSPNWLFVPDVVSVVGTNNRVSISPLTGSRYFRLFQP